MRLPRKLHAPLLSVAILAIVSAVWEGATQTSRDDGVRSEYEMLVAGADETARLPRPSEIAALGLEMLSDPVYDRGPNDKGIGLQLVYSLGRVALGYIVAVLVAVPIGFLIGMSPLMLSAFNPFIQVLKPISPLAWMPLALFVIKDSVWSSVFVIFICSVWPILINTAFGVSSVRKDFINVSRTLELSRLRTALFVILPAAAPTILTGMRISIGIAWLVIVAAEMLVGGTGVGYFVWNEWNNLDLASVVVSILMIGVVGMGLDFLLAQAQRAVAFEDA
ncbi:MAG: nitrate ABC transporter permease [Myxococcales bacterium]|nr:nitrate ABC transporter permease [Myxococcales bacterium]